MKPINKEIKALDPCGHTIYFNLSDCVAVYFQDTKPVHVRFWDKRVPDPSHKATAQWVQFQLRAMGWESATLGDWHDQDIDAPFNGGLIAKVTL